MKILIKDCIALLLIAGLNIVIWNSESKSNTEEYVNEQNVKLNNSNSDEKIATTQKDTYSGFQKFVNKSNTMISNNEKNIEDLKFNSALIKEPEKIVYLIRVDNLEDSNDVLKTELNVYILEGNGNWMTFKVDFDKKLEKLDLAFNEVDKNLY
jgi:uncharacterized protein YxeA